MSRVTVDELMDELYEMLDRAAKLPLSGGKCLLGSRGGPLFIK